MRVLDDEYVEEDETFTVTLSAPSGATIADGEGEGTIVDDGDQPPTLRIDDVSVAEDGGDAEFTVTLSRASVADVTVWYATTDGTARAEQDYTGTSGRLSIPAGSTTGTIAVRVLDDEYVEEDETFTVTLSAPSGATIADGEGEGTIVDDGDQPPTLRIDDVSVAEDGGDAEFTVTLSSGERGRTRRCWAGCDVGRARTRARRRGRTSRHVSSGTLSDSRRGAPTGTLDGDDVLEDSNTSRTTRPSR